MTEREKLSSVELFHEAISEMYNTNEQDRRDSSNDKVSKIMAGLLQMHKDEKSKHEAKHVMTPLMFAAKNGDTHKVELLLKKGADGSCTDSNGYTALWYACKYKQLECVEVLLRSKSCTPNTKFAKAYEVMLDNDIIEIIKKLMIETSNLYYMHTFGGTVLFYGCIVGSLATVKMIVEKDIVEINMYALGKTPLLAALSSSSLEIAHYLIRMGADLKIKDCNGKNAYDYAAKFDASETFLETYEPEEQFLEKLLESLIRFSRFKALRTYVDKCAKKQRILMQAFISASPCYKEGIKIILSRITDKSFIIEQAMREIKYRMFERFGPLYERLIELEKEDVWGRKVSCELFNYAVDSSNPDVVQYLLNRGFDLNEIKNVRAGFIVSYCWINANLVESFFNYGADINWIDSHHGSALFYSIMRNNLSNVQMLLRHGADTRVKTSDGYMALNAAAKLGCTEIFFELFKVDKDVCQRSTDQITPFLAACASGNTQIANALSEAGACLKDVDIKNRNCLHLAAYSLNLRDITVFLYEKLGKDDFNTMITAVDDEGNRPVDLIINYDDKIQISNLVMAVPDLANFIEAPVFVKIDNSTGKSRKLCVMCRKYGDQNERAVIMPCNHMFHEECFSESYEDPAEECPKCDKPGFILKSPKKKTKTIKTIKQ